MAGSEAQSFYYPSPGQTHLEAACFPQISTFTSGKVFKPPKFQRFVAINEI